MRTAPVALAYLGADDEPALATAARAISDLTHFEADAGDACVLWSLAIRHAVMTGQLDVRRGIAFLPVDRRAVWSERLDVAERSRPRDFAKNGWVVEALQGAWSAITHVAVPSELPARHLQLTLEEAVRGGRDADTVAAIAGGLLGARWGSSAIPSQWKRKLHGWPGLRTRDLTNLAVLAANAGRADRQGWPTTERMHSPYATFVQHSHDEGVWLGGLAALDALPTDIDAVVSLCRTGSRQTDREQIEIWLVDQPGESRNPNLDFVLLDAADTIAALRAEGKRVFVHCWQGASRTPSVGALYAARHRGVAVERALHEVTRALPDGAPGPFLREAVTRLGHQSTASAAGGENPASRRPEGPTSVRQVANDAPQPSLSDEPDPQHHQHDKPILYIDLDNTLVDFGARLATIDQSILDQYRDNLDEIPGIFALMPPMPGAIEAYRELCNHYEVFILSTAPWKNPSAWQHKVEWVQLHFGIAEDTPAYKRLILSHHKELNRGRYLIDDRPHNGAREFGEVEGQEWIRFGAGEYGDVRFRDWSSVVDELIDSETEPCSKTR